MRHEDAEHIAAELGSALVATRTLAGGFSHETSLLTLADGQVVVRLGGGDPGIEAAVMAAGRRQVPVPRVLRILPDGDRPAMVLEFVAGTPLSDVLSGEVPDPAGLGTEVGRVVARIGTVRFDRPGFFTDESLAVRPERPWSQQLPEIAAACVAATPRLDEATKRAWVDLCTAHAPALVAVDDHTRLVHADINPKNILVTRAQGAWSVAAILDWEFSFSSCPYGDAANMARFGADYPASFLEAFLAAFAEHQPADLPLPDNWRHLGNVLDMFALSDLITRPLGHAVADQAAARIRQLLSE